MMLIKINIRYVKNTFLSIKYIAYFNVQHYTVIYNKKMSKASSVKITKHINVKRYL